MTDIDILNKLEEDAIRIIERNAEILKEIQRIREQTLQDDREKLQRLTRKEVSELLGIAQGTVSTWNAEGLEFDRSGLITKHDLRKWVDEHKPARSSRLDGVWLKNMTLKELAHGENYTDTIGVARSQKPVQ